MKRYFVLFTFLASAAQAYDLSPLDCQAATESTGQITERRDQGYTLADLKDNIDHWRASYQQPEIVALLKDLADWVYAQPAQSPIELATRFWNQCSRSAGRLTALPVTANAGSLDVFECLTVVDMSRHIRTDLARGRTLDNVLVEIWSAQDDDGSVVAVSGLATLAKSIYADQKVHPDAHALKFLQSCLATAEKTAAAR